MKEAFERFKSAVLIDGMEYSEGVLRGLDALNELETTVQSEIGRLTAERDALMADADIVSYGIEMNRFKTIRVERVRQSDGSPLWAVRLDGECLNTSGEWEFEPMPSGRDGGFLTRCRFPDARAAILAARSKGKEGSE